MIYLFCDLLEINAMKTDTLFYRLFQRWPKLALELLVLECASES